MHERVDGKIRIRIPAVHAFGSTERADLVTPVSVRLFRAPGALLDALKADPDLLHEISPDQLEEVVCDRLFAMGFEPERAGAANRPDGGIDIVFWPRIPSAFPFLGAVQVTHRSDSGRRVGPSKVRDFAGVLGAHPFQVGVLVTNTSFTPDAEWFARQDPRRIRLRGFQDIRRWLLEVFDHDAEWREMPSEIELCPGTILKIPRPWPVPDRS